MRIVFGLLPYYFFFNPYFTEVETKQKGTCSQSDWVWQFGRSDWEKTELRRKPAALREGQKGEQRGSWAFVYMLESSLSPNNKK